MNKLELLMLAKQAALMEPMIADYPDPDNKKVTFPPSPYYRFFALLAKNMGANLAVELGVCGGGGSLHLAMGARQVIGVDKTYAEYWDNVKWITKHYPNVQLFEGDSIEMASSIYASYGLIDILFIDTIHTYDRTMAEYAAYKPYLSKRALVMLDDLYRPGMDRAWDEIPCAKERFDFLHPQGSPTDGGFGVIWT